MSFQYFYLGQLQAIMWLHIARRHEDTIQYHSYNTRRSDNLHTPVGRTETIYKTFSFYGVHMWNHISSTIQTVCFLHVF